MARNQGTIALSRQVLGQPFFRRGVPPPRDLRLDVVVARERLGLGEQTGVFTIIGRHRLSIPVAAEPNDRLELGRLWSR
jgi:hypothetical protein